MNNKIDILIKCIVLLHREVELQDPSNDGSKDLIKTVINTLNVGKNSLIGGESMIIEDLKQLILDMINNPDNYDKLNLLQSLELILKDKEAILKVVEKSINLESNIGGIKRSILSIRNHLSNYYKETEISNLIKKASYQLTTNNIDTSIQDFTTNLISNLEALSISTKTKDAGIVDEVDMHDDDSVGKTMDDIKKQAEDGGKSITGWKGVNKMMNGGIRRGEQWVISALQHNYKSGFVQSLFVQLSTLNKPDLIDKNKKPLNILFSFEDDINIITEFIYRYIYFNENKVLPDMTTLTGKEIGKYVSSKLSVTGFHVKILRINPAEWTYKNLFNKILEYEAEGYEIHNVIIDYLSKLPTTGCITSGPMGTDVRDLFNRVRNFCSSKKITCITPHQISTEALGLVRSGVTGFDFINELSNKNYYSESKQIPQVVDGEIYLSKGKKDKKWALFIGKGKHRTPTITPDEDKQTLLWFPLNAPIPEDIHEEDTLENKPTGEDEFDF